MLQRYRNIPKSMGANKYYKITTNYFKFSYFFNINKVISKHDFIDQLPTDLAQLIKENASENPIKKFESFFGMLNLSTSQELIYCMEPIM
jgi:hypothetical protein